MYIISTFSNNLRRLWATSSSCCTHSRLPRKQNINYYNRMLRVIYERLLFVDTRGHCGQCDCVKRYSGEHNSGWNERNLITFESCDVHPISTFAFAPLTMDESAREKKTKRKKREKKKEKETRSSKPNAGDSLTSTFRSTNFFFYYYLLWSVVTVVGHCFNVDTEYPTVFQGPDQSYFGYSVALHKNSRGKWLLAGAPKANCTFLQLEYNITEPGVLYKCQLETRTCSQIVADRTGNSVVNPFDRKNGYKDLKDGGWLGVSLDVKPTNDSQIIVCAHQWKNQRYRQHYLTNGICYVIGPDLETPLYKLAPLVYSERQIVPPGIYFYAMGQAGLASHYTENGEGLVLGAPGVLDWTGTIVYYSQTNAAKTNEYSTPLIPLPLAETPDVIYFGYSVSSGKFFADDDDIYIVVGAPRDENKGRVYVMSQPRSSNKNQVLVRMTEQGTQMGEYFGSCVCAVDLNNDGLADLLVGAPQHAIRVNEGRIYAFINQRTGFLKPVRESLMGDALPNSHFGSAIGAIGDINQDDYQDVAVGAPYEGDGAVYIYRGTDAGINPKYVQKIQAKQIAPTIKGLGISFSRGNDMDDNLYPDFAVGAFDSNNAILLKTKPVVSVSARLNFNPTEITADSGDCHATDGSHRACFHVDTCMYFTGKWTPSKLDIQFSLTMDTLRPNQSRVYFHHLNTADSFLTSALTLYEKKETCVTYEIHLHPNLKDFLTPISFLLNFNLDQPSPNDNENKGFCKTCPTLDPDCPLELTSEVMFVKNCGSDDICQADLRVTGALRNYGPLRPFVIGSSSEVHLDLTAANGGEPAYQTTLRVQAPSWAYFSKMPPTCVTQFEDSTIACSVGNPLTHGHKAKLSVNVNVENMPSRAREALFNITVHTASSEREEHLLDNSLFLALPLTSVADISISGISSHEQVTTNSVSESAADAKLFFSHKYEVSKFEPSPIDSVTMEISIPVTSMEHKEPRLTLFNIRSLKFHESVMGNAIFGTCEGVEENMLTPSHMIDASMDPNKRQKRQTRDRRAFNHQNFATANGRKDVHIMNCSNAHCHVIRCWLGSFLLENETLSLEIAIEPDAKNLQNYMSSLDSIDTLQLTSFGQVFINDGIPDIQPPNHKQDQAWVTTDFVSLGPIKPKPISLWIIVVSCLAGCLLLLLFTVALVKLGFFRRKEQEEMRSLINTSAYQNDDRNSLTADSDIFESDET